MNSPKLIWEIQEVSHPFLNNLKIRILLSQRDIGARATCFIVSCPIGVEIEEHTHGEQDDIMFVIEGEAIMWIEGVGEFPLTLGTFVAVSKGKRHRTFNVGKNLLIYNVLTPTLF
jgi:mannose-6-phosphate isomerase-like protein (cupin superfamily)